MYAYRDAGATMSQTVYDVITHEFVKIAKIMRSSTPYNSFSALSRRIFNDQGLTLKHFLSSREDSCNI